MTRCVGCGGRLRGDVAFCSACGAAAGGGVLELEPDTNDNVGTEGRDVVLARPMWGRGRVVCVVVVAALVAMATAGVLTGGQGERSSSSTTTATPSTSTSSTSPTTTPPVIASSTTAATTDITAATVTTVARTIRLGSAPLLGAASGLDVLVMSGLVVYRVDLDAATATLTALTVTDFGFFRQTSVGVLKTVSNQSDQPVLYPTDGSPPRLLEVRGNFLGEGPPGRLWFRDYGNDGSKIAFVEPTSSTKAVALDSTGLPDNVLADGLHGLLGVAPGGIYRLQPPAPAQRISDGNLLAATNGYLVDHTCDSHLHCTTGVLDTRTGHRQALPTSPPPNYFGAMVSSDGRWVLMTRFLNGGNTTRGQLTMTGIDGSTVDLGITDIFCDGRGCGGSPGWSPDGHWLVGVRDGQTLWAWRPGLKAPLPVPLSTADTTNAMPVAGSILLVSHATVISARPPATG